MDKMFTEADIDYKSFNDGERSFVAYASKPVIDRDREVISWDAWELANYKKNPVGLWAHDYRGKPVFRSMWIRQTQEGLKFKPAFADTDEGKETYQLYKQKMLNAFSVGFIPKKWHDPGDEDDDKTRDVAGDEKARKRLPRRIYDKVELLEISCVPVPACPDALVEAFKEGKIKTKGIADYIEQHTEIEDQGPHEEQSGATDDDTINIRLEQKPEEPGDYIRLPVKGEEGKHDGHKIRTMTVSKKQGIKALYCVDCKKIITYLFDKSCKSKPNKCDWTMKQAREWMREHGKTATEMAEGLVDSIADGDDSLDSLETEEGVVYGEWEEEEKTEIEISEEELDDLAAQLAERTSRKQALGSISDDIAELKARIKVLRGGVG